MFNNIFNSIAQKLSGLNPIKTFIKYALDKFLNQLINDKITLSDFKDGCLNITSIGLNSEKVNQKHLISSPYILYSGIIGSLKIKLPSLSALNTKSIQIELKEICLELHPNKDFYQNFKESIKQLRENMSFDQEDNVPDQEISQNNPMDFFKQTLRQILLNIRIKVENVVVKVYMNNLGDESNQQNNSKHMYKTQQNKQKHKKNAKSQKQKNQYYLMIRIPFINVHKSDQVKSKVKNIQQIKLNIQIPQFSMHLINQNMVNEKNQINFPFKYPTIYHPSTILLFGIASLDGINIQKDKSVPRLNIAIITDYQNNRRQTKIDAVASNIQVMIDPIQLKILSRFVLQIRQFKNIFGFVKNQLQISQCHSSQVSVQDSTIRRHSSQQRSTDLFASIAMSTIFQPTQNTTSRIRNSTRTKSPKPNDLLSSMIHKSTTNQDLTKSISQYNREFQNQLMAKNKLQEVSSQLESQLRVVSFNKTFQFHIEVMQIFAIVLKQTTKSLYIRKWMANFNDKKVNTSIPTHHFMFDIQSLIFGMKQKGKNIQLTFNKLQVQNVKISSPFTQQKKQQQQPQQKQIKVNKSIDLQASCQLFASCRQSFEQYSSIPYNSIQQPIVPPIPFIRMPSIQPISQPIQYILPAHSHHCIQSLIYICQKPTQTILNPTYKKYNFLPRTQEVHQYVPYKPGFRLTVNKTGKVQLQDIAVSLNAEVLKDLLEIKYPIKQYKELATHFTHQNQTFIKDYQINANSHNQHQNLFRKKSLMESNYNFDNLHQNMDQDYVQNRGKKPVIQVHIQQISLGWYQAHPNKFQNIIQKSKNILHYQLENKCFCAMNTPSVYFQCFGIRVDVKDQSLKLSVKKIISGLFKILNSKVDQIDQVKALLLMQGCSQQKQLKLFLQKNHSTQTQHLSLFTPFLQIIIQRQQTLQLICVLQTQLQTIKSLKSYYNHLFSQMKSISHNSSSPIKNKQPKPNPQYQLELDVFVKEFRAVALEFVMEVRSLMVSKVCNRLHVKIASVVAAMRNRVGMFLNQMVNQQFKKKEFIQKIFYKNTKIYQSNIILQIPQINSSTKQQLFQSKNRLVYFQNSLKRDSAISFKINRNQMRQGDQNKNKQSRQSSQLNDKFKFAKKPVKNSMKARDENTITQQQQFKQIILSICSPVYINGSNCCRILQKKALIQKFMGEISILTKQLRLNSKSLSPPVRKASTDSEIQKFQQLQVILNKGSLVIDIRPSFMEGSASSKHIQKEITYSSTRSLLEIKYDKIRLAHQKRIDLRNIEGAITLKYYFLQANDINQQTNPIRINVKDMNILGFIQILQITNIKLSTQNIKSKIRGTLDIGQVKFNASIQTLSYLKLHWQHFMKHNVKRQFGLTFQQQYQKTQVMDPNLLPKPSCQQSDSDQQIQVSTQAFQKYTNLLTQKKQNEKIFIQKKFLSPELSKTCPFFIQELKIKQFLVKVYSGSDFQFINCQSLMESKEKKRTRVNIGNQAQMFKYIQLRMDYLTLAMKLEQKQNKFNPIQHQISLNQIKQHQIQQHNSKSNQIKQHQIKQHQKVEKYNQIEVFAKLQNFQINYSSRKNIKGFLGKLFNQNNYQQVIFPIARNTGQIKLLLQMSPAKKYIKMNKVSWDFGFTSQILQLINEMQKSASYVQLSGWVKSYQPAAQTHKKPSKSLFLLYLPQNTLIIRLIYKSVSLLSSKSLSMKQLLLHEQMINNKRIKKVMVKWVKAMLLGNAGTLIGGSAMGVLGKGVDEVVLALKFVLGFLFKGN